MTRPSVSMKLSRILAVVVDLSMWPTTHFSSSPLFCVESNNVGSTAGQHAGPGQRSRARLPQLHKTFSFFFRKNKKGIRKRRKGGGNTCWVVGKGFYHADTSSPCWRGRRIHGIPARTPVERTLWRPPNMAAAYDWTLAGRLAPCMVTNDQYSACPANETREISSFSHFSSSYFCFPFFCAGFFWRRHVQEWLKLHIM